MKIYTPEKATWENVIALEAEIPKRNAEDARELPGKSKESIIPHRIVNIPIARALIPVKVLGDW